MDGYGTPKSHVERVADLGMSALALTEHGNVSSHVQLEKHALKAGIKPIFGCELYTGPMDMRETKNMRKWHLTAVAMNSVGYHNLMKLVSRSWEEGFYRWPTVLGNMLADHNEGIIFTSGCADSKTACDLLGGKGRERGDINDARRTVQRFRDLLGDRFYLEVQAFPELGRTKSINPAYEEFSRQFNVPLVATADVHYPYPEDNEMQKILHAAGRNTGTVAAAEASWEYDILLTYPTSDKAIYERLRGTGLSRAAAESAILGSTEISGRCNVTLEKAERLAFPLDGTGARTNAELFRNWIRDGWDYRRIPSTGRVSEYRERLKYEMYNIETKGFTDYFLLLSDLVRFAKDSGIPVGPARGSAAASLVCYLLRITEIDPMQYPLMLFERFIDISRADLPDIDLDFADDRRHEVREYLVRKYGADRVGNIGNFVRYRGKNAINDVARVHQIPQWEANIINGLVVERSGGDSRFDASLEDTKEMFPAAKAVFDKHPALELAIKLEGNTKGMSVHAAGLVVANTPITDTCATYSRNSGHDRRPTKVLSIDKYDAEYLDIMKIDALGLSTMGMISICLDLIGMSLEDLYKIPMDDPKTLDAFTRADVIGIFQFEGRATRIVCADVKPDTFLEVSDVNALSRPGPLFSGMTAQYVNVKHGKATAEKLHPIVDALTEPTKGQIIYQEQVLEIIREIGGFPVTKVGEIRRIISKKMGEAQFNTMLEDFIAGAYSRHQIERDLAIRIWKFMVTSATYSFCCTGETIVERAGAGRYCPDPKATIADLYTAQESKSPIGDKMRYGPGIRLLGMDDDGRVRPSRLIKIHDPVERPIMKITTESGITLRASHEHKILTADGYRLFSDLVIGDIAICMGEKEMPKRSGEPTWREGKPYRGKGVPTGEDNPGWIDGRSAALKRAHLVVRSRANGTCENCKIIPEDNKHSLEFAHMLSLEFFDGDYIRYNSSANILYLCNSCHKKLDYAKGERKKRWTKGRPTVHDRIVSIEDDGVDLVYDITMEGPAHNYISNEVVSHNNTAHSISYSTLAWWCQYLKQHHPLEFYCAALIKARVGGVVSATGAVAGGSGSNLITSLPLIKDARRHGIRLVPPDLRRSGITWSIDRSTNEIVAGFSQAKGVGEKLAKVIVDDREANGDFKDWNDLVRVKGIGPKKIEVIRESADNDDPFGLERTRRIITSVTDAIRRKELPVPMPTHNSDKLAAQETINRAIFIGIVKLKEYKDVIEDERSRSGDDLDVIRARIKSPDSAKSCTLHCYDDGDEDVYVRVNRFIFAKDRKIQRQLESIRPGKDVIVAFGKKQKVFGISFQVEQLWVIDPEDD